MSRCMKCDSDKGKGTYCDDCRASEASISAKQAERKELFLSLCKSGVIKLEADCEFHIDSWLGKNENLARKILSAAEKFSRGE